MRFTTSFLSAADSHKAGINHRSVYVIMEMEGKGKELDEGEGGGWEYLHQLDSQSTLYREGSVDVIFIVNHKLIILILVIFQSAWAQSV